MFKQRHLVHALAMGLLVLSLLATGGTAAAQSGGTVVASGLMGPFGIAVGDDGSVYVTESGSGGPNVVGEGDQQVHWGLTGQVTRIAPDGSKTVVARNLPSAATSEGVLGASDVLWANGALWVLMGNAPEPALQQAGAGKLLRIDAATGSPQAVADLSAFETASNPDPNQVDSNPYGLALGPDGQLYVADAGGNDVLRVNPANGQVSLVAVIPGIGLPPGMQAPPGGNPERGGKNELDPVPTGVAFGPDGNLYVSLLSGGPFPPGAAKIVQVTPGGQVTDAAGGLTMLTDIALGPDNNWYVVSFGEFGEQGPVPGSGKVLRITAGGQQQVVAEGLLFPNKLA
ncbi:MAG TPA: ScyD/ScyE family protein, partial [Chloroflexia bacterium]|nr:ScyD/ScyE family protein [Chloroflexia bacterium]